MLGSLSTFAQGGHDISLKSEPSLLVVSRQSVLQLSFILTAPLVVNLFGAVSYSLPATRPHHSQDHSLTQQLSGRRVTFLGPKWCDENRNVVKKWPNIETCLRGLWQLSLIV